MSTLPLLLEIGTEEIPDWMIKGALENLRELTTSILGLAVANVRVDAAPRRGVRRAPASLDREPESEEVVRGPARSAHAGAGAGFAKKLGVKPEELASEAGAKGEYYIFKKQVAG